MADSTRTRLIAAAWDCTRDGGIAKATSRAITHRARANLGAITYHFGSKEHLLAQAFVWRLQTLLAPALEALAASATSVETDSTGDPLMRTLAAASHLQRALAESSNEAPALLETLLYSRRSPALHQAVQSLLGDIRTSLAQQMEEQRTTKFLPPWVDPNAMAGLLLAVAQGIALQSCIDIDGPPPTDVVNQFLQLLVTSRTS